MTVDDAIDALAAMVARFCQDEDGRLYDLGEEACADALAILVERGIVTKDEEGDMRWG